MKTTVFLLLVSFCPSVFAFSNIECQCKERGIAREPVTFLVESYWTTDQIREEGSRQCYLRHKDSTPMFTHWREHVAYNCRLK